MSYANPEDCRIMATIQAENRRRLDARIDRELRKRQDGLGDLYRRGVNASAEIKAERKAHRLTAERDGRYGWRAVCACGEWQGRTTASKRLAESDADREHDRFYRPLSAIGRHSETPAAVKGVA